MEGQQQQPPATDGGSNSPEVDMHDSSSNMRHIKIKQMDGQTLEISVPIDVSEYQKRPLYFKTIILT